MRQCLKHYFIDITSIMRLQSYKTYIQKDKHLWINLIETYTKIAVHMDKKRNGKLGGNDVTLAYLLLWKLIILSE